MKSKKIILILVILLLVALNGFRNQSNYYSKNIKSMNSYVNNEKNNDILSNIDENIKIKLEEKYGKEWYLKLETEYGKDWDIDLKNKYGLNWYELLDVELAQCSLKYKDNKT